MKKGLEKMKAINFEAMQELTATEKTKMAEEIENIIANMSDERFEKFCELFSTKEKEMFKQIRFWHKMQNDKDFYKKVEQEIAKEIYRDFN